MKTIKPAIVSILFFKIILLTLFSSDYQNRLFIPFVEHFISHLGNPWQQFYINGQIDAFPYHPLMLYIVSLFYLPFHLLFHNSIILQNLFFKIPTLLSDLLITCLLYKLFPRKLKEIAIFYFASPIIIYASYMHSQLDLIPTAILFLSIYLLISNKILLSAFVFSCALITKFHVIAALPLIIAYLLKNNKRFAILNFIAIPTLVYFIFSIPYIFSKSYFNMVLSNQRQQLIFDTFYKIGDSKIYLSILTGLIVIVRFVFYKKINNDLFYAFLGILFSLLVLTIVPGPAWYLWMLPFLCIFFIKFHTEDRRIFYLYLALNITYIIYFVLFYIPDHPDLTFLNTPLNFKIYDERLRNIFFTALETVLFVTIYFFYKLGVKSNLVYTKDNIIIIGIGGDSGAGKTVLSSDIKFLLGNKLLWLEGDAGHRWERNDEHWQIFNHFNPKANFIYRQAENLLKLKMGKSIFWMDYDHNTGKFTDQKKIHVEDFIIFSGVHTFYLPIMREIIDLRIYVDIDERIRRHWKIVRDIRERNYTKDAIVAQIERRMADAQKYVYPQKEHAEMIINYFTKDNFEVGALDYDPPMKLKIVLGSGIDIEFVVNRLIQENIDIIWDYADDLRTQHVLFSKPPKKQIIESIAQESIINREEMLSSNPIWLDGYRGLTQLFILLVLSEKIKKKGDYYEI